MKALSVLLVGFVNFQVAASSMLELDAGAIEYEVKEGGDRVVLFDAGVLSGMAGWDSIWERLPADITAIRFSRLGEGNSEPCSGQRGEAVVTRHSGHFVQDDKPELVVSELVKLLNNVRP